MNFFKTPDIDEATLKWYTIFSKLVDAAWKDSAKGIRIYKEKEEKAFKEWVEVYKLLT